MICSTEDSGTSTHGALLLVRYGLLELRNQRLFLFVRHANRRNGRCVRYHTLGLGREAHIVDKALGHETGRQAELSHWRGGKGIISSRYPSRDREKRRTSGKHRKHVELILYSVSLCVGLMAQRSQPTTYPARTQGLLESFPARLVHFVVQRSSRFVQFDRYLKVLDRGQSDKLLALGVFGVFCSAKQGLRNKSL